MKKIARKHSSDPAQETLRQAKADWNKATSALIGGLIALKRGLNGRGDSKTGLPPSTIKDPLPGAVGEKLHDLASQFNSVVSAAESIIQSQAEYSRTRNQPKTEGNSVVTASWIGSRTWAQMPLIGNLSTDTDRYGNKLSKENRKLRVQLIKFCHSMRKFMKEMEDQLVSSEPKDLAQLIYNLNAFKNDYRLLFLEPIKLYIQEYSPREEIPGEQDISPEDFAVPPTQETSQPLPSTGPNQATDPLKNFKDAVAEIKRYMPIFFKFHKNLSPEADFANDYEELSDLLIVIENAFWDEKARALIDLNRLVQTAYRLFIKLKSQIETEVKVEEPEPIKQLEANYNQYYQELTKLAGNPLTNWFKKMKMQIWSSNEEILKLKALDLIKVLDEELDHIMNNLEDSKSNPAQLGFRVDGLNNNLTLFIEIIRALGEKYQAKARMNKKELSPLPQNLFSQLSQFENLLDQSDE